MQGQRKVFLFDGELLKSDTLMKIVTLPWKKNARNLSDVFLMIIECSFRLSAMCGTLL